MHNEEKCYKSSEITLDKLVDFSEGNRALYDLLKYCFENKIYTSACCKGHEDNFLNFSYVMFPLNYSNFHLMGYVAENMLKNKLRKDVCFKMWYGYDGLSLSIESYNLKKRDDFFDTIKESFIHYKNNENYTIRYFNILLELFFIYKEVLSKDITNNSLFMYIQCDNIFLDNQKRDIKLVRQEDESLQREYIKSAVCYKHLKDDFKSKYEIFKFPDGVCKPLEILNPKKYKHPLQIYCDKVVNDDDLFGDEIINFSKPNLVANSDLIEFYKKSKECMNKKNYRK